MIKILIPTDFSIMSVNAIKTAVDIAKLAGEHSLTIVHVYERSYMADIHYSADGGSRLMVDKEKTHEIQLELVQEMKELVKIPELKGMNVKSHILADIDVEEIVDDELIGHQDLIVMGTHGMKGVKDFFIGAHAHKVMRETKIPVLSVKDTIEPSAFKKVVFVSEFTEDMDGVADRLKPVMEALNAEVTLLKIITPSNFEKTSVSKKAAEKFKQKHAHFAKAKFQVYNHEDVEEGVRAYAIENGVDLVCIATHGRTGFSHLIFGSISEDIVDDTPLPVLSVKM